MSVLTENDQGDSLIEEELNSGGLDLIEARLYSSWEHQHWSATSVDFTRDRQDWIGLPEEQQIMLIDSIATFFAGEERIAVSFAPLLLSAEDQQQAAFLATQQSDEVRHMLFFDRLWREVLGIGEDSTRAAVAGARARCNEAFSELFDRRLAGVLDRLRLNPRDRDAKVEAVTIYHLIVEGLMGLTGMHFLIDYFERKSILANVASTLKMVRRDEHRHIAWGTSYLRSRCREQERDGFLVQNALLELLPVASGVLVEGGQAACDGLDPVEFLDYPSVRVSYFALEGLSRRLKLIGGATEEVQHFVASGAWRASRLM